MIGTLMFSRRLITLLNVARARSIEIERYANAGEHARAGGAQSMKPPNKRVRLTRSSALSPDSPLTRHSLRRRTRRHNARLSADAPPLGAPKDHRG